MTMELVTVTPDLAKIWLEGNVANRRIKESQIDRLARDMKLARWIVNGDAIKFSENDRLEDGQHRLLACMQSDAPFETWVAHNCPPRTQESLAGAVPRSFTDQLQMRGYHDPHRIAGVTRTAASIEVAGRYDPKDRRLTSIFDLSDAFHNNQEEILSAVRFTVGHYLADVSDRRPPPTMIASCLFMFRRHNAKVGDWFVEHLYSQASVGLREPVYLLRRRFSPRDKLVRLDYRLKWALIIKAYNFTVEGNEIGRLAWRSAGPVKEDFPQVGDVHGNGDEYDGAPTLEE